MSNAGYHSVLAALHSATSCTPSRLLSGMMHTWRLRSSNARAYTFVAYVFNSSLLKEARKSSWQLLLSLPSSLPLSVLTRLKQIADWGFVHSGRKGDLECQEQPFNHHGRSQLQEEEVTVVWGRMRTDVAHHLAVSWADSKQVPTQQPRAHWMPKPYLDSKKCSNWWKKM